MAIAFYDSTQTPFGSAKFRSFHDGHIGGVHEEIIYIRNDSASVYYTNVIAQYEAPDPGDIGEFGDTGWGIKILAGQRRPTEAEWDLVATGATLALDDIGAFGAADTSTYFPIWVRSVCPGDSPAQIRILQQIKISYYEQSA